MANEYVNKVVLASGETLIDLSGDNATAPKVLKDYTFHDKSGKPSVGECTFDADTSGDNMDEDMLLEGGTGHARGTKINGAMPNNGGNNVVINNKNGVSIPRGYYDGSGKAMLSATDIANIKPENIREGVTILEIDGTMSGSEGVKAQSKTVKPTFIAQNITPDTAQGYTHLSQVEVQAISVVYTDNAAGGKTVTIG